MKKHVFQNELEKQRWDDSILVLKMKLENVLTKKIRLRILGIFTRWISISAHGMWPDNEHWEK